MLQKQCNSASKDATAAAQEKCFSSIFNTENLQRFFFFLHGYICFDVDFLVGVRNVLALCCL